MTRSWMIHEAYPADLSEHSIEWCKCIYQAHCHPGKAGLCKLREGGTIGPGGGVCRPKEASPPPTRGAVDPERPHCPQCGRGDITRDAPCPTPGCLTFPWKTYWQNAGTPPTRGAVPLDRVVSLIREMAETQDYATMCSWRALASRLEAELAEPSNQPRGDS